MKSQDEIFFLKEIVYLRLINTEVSFWFDFHLDY